MGQSPSSVSDCPPQAKGWLEWATRPAKTHEIGVQQPLWACSPGFRVENGVPVEVEFPAQRRFTARVNPLPVTNLWLKLAATS